MQRRKRRIGPRVPAPDIRTLQHRPAIDARDRVVHRLRIVPQHSLDQPPLHPVVAGARRVRRQSVLAALRILEQVRRIAPAIHRRTAELGQPDRLHPRNPGRRRRLPCAAHALMMPVRPPALQILITPDPVFAVGAVRDRRAPLRRPIRRAGVEPVIPLAARDLRRQIGRVRRPFEIFGVPPAVAAAPVAHRRIPIDADVIDIRVRPQRIEVKPNLSVPLPAEILRPVGGVAQLDPRPDHRPALRRQRPKLRHRRKAPVRIPRPGQPPHLRADQQAVRPLIRRHPGIVQRQPPQPPTARRPEQGRDLSRRPGPVRPRDPPSPRIAGAVHEDEGIQRHLQPARLQRPDRLPHALVRRRPAIGRAFAALSVVDPADQMRVRARHPRHAPDQRLGRLVPPLHPWPDTAMPHPHVIAEPAEHQTDPLQPRSLGHQLIQRGLQVRLTRRQMHVLRRGLRQPLAPHHRLGRQAELSRAGDQAHALQPVFQLRRRPLRPPEHLERQLRRPVAIGVQRQILEHHIGRPAIGGRPPLHRLDQRIGRLIFRPAMQTHRHARHIHRLAVSPDPADPVDRPLAQGHGEAQRIGVVDRLLAALAARPLLLPLQKARGPDHLPDHPRPSEDAGHRRPLGRGLQLQPLQPRPDLPRRRQPGDHPAIRRPPQHPADKAPDRSAQRRPDPAQNDLRHACSFLNLRPAKRRDQTPAPPRPHPAFDHRPPPIGVDHPPLRPLDRAQHGAMLGRTARRHAEQQHIAQPRLLRRDLHQPPPRRGPQRLLAPDLGPVGTIGRRRLRLLADCLAPHPAHQAQTVRPLALHAGLMSIGRPQPPPRRRHDPRAPFGIPHRLRLRPSLRPATGRAVRKSSPGMSGKP
ncbi:proteophosphoglycan ppg4 [Brevundimonas diminuta ATCC 11568]|nr:proteophosphoglycan ppg4 [Brevundimonas diminuta ATCC 11568]